MISNAGLLPHPMRFEKPERAYDVDEACSSWDDMADEFVFQNRMTEFRRKHPDASHILLSIEAGKLSTILADKNIACRNPRLMPARYLPGDHVPLLKT